MVGDNGNVPVLGGGDEPLPDIGPFTAVSIVRSLDANGMRKPAQVRLAVVNGQITQEAIMGRDSFVTAEELVEMCREAVREELKNFLKAIRGSV